MHQLHVYVINVCTTPVYADCTPAILTQGSPAEMSAIQAASALTAEQEADDPVPYEPDMDVGDDTSSDAASYKPLGKSNARQWMAAIAMCQHLQQLLLYGSDTQPGLNTEPLIKMDMQNRRRAENERRNNSLVDAARLKPEMKDEEKLQMLADHYLGREGRREQLSGLKGHAMHVYSLSGMARGQQARDLRKCQILTYDLPPVPDVPGSQQVMHVTAYGRDTGKLSVGDRTNYSATAKHKNVGLTLLEHQSMLSS